MLLFEDYKEKIIGKIKDIYPEVEGRDIEIDETGHGDFTFRTFKLAKVRKLEPEQIFKNLENAFKNENYIEAVTRVGNYINFTLKTKSMFGAIDDSMTRTGIYPDTFQDPERVSVEHTSANPTGPLHVGRSRNSIIGDSVARMLSRYGYRVTRQYFVNDSGKQMMALYEGYRRFFPDKEPTLDTLLSGYRMIYKEMEENKEIEKTLERRIKSYEEGDPELIANIRKIASIVLGSIEKVLKQLDISVDDYTWESDFIRSGEINEILEALGDKLQSENGAKYIEPPAGRKVFLTRADGTSLYFARDIAYHRYKTQNFDWTIDVLGEDHKEHGKYMEYFLKELMDIEQKVEFLFYSFISLETGKMSTRRGNVVTLQDLIERTEEETYSIVKEKRKDLPDDKLKEISKAVAASSIRFNIIRVSANKPLTFRWSEALNFEGDSAPFIMYSYARASSILKKVNGETVQPDAEFDDPERVLVRQLFLYPYFISSAKESLRPDIIAAYLLDLVKAFNDFYAKCPVLTAEEKDRNKRIKLVEYYKNILEDSSSLVGIKMMEEM